MTSRHTRLASAALALSAFGLISGGCEEYKGEEVNYGPEIPVSKVLGALREPVANSDPSQTKIGAFVHFATYQIIAGGQVQRVTADTGDTVTSRREDATSVTYSIVESRHSYKADGSVDKLTREFEISFDKPAAAAGAQVPVANAKSVGSGSVETPFSGWSKPVTNQLTALNQELQSFAGKSETYHNLRVSNFKAPAPDAVHDQPNCLGLPNCQMNFTRIAFDQVFWDKNHKSDRIFWDFIVSPDVPQISGFNMSLLFNYYPGLVKSCVTLRVPNGTGDQKVLLQECREVVNFRFESATN